MWAVPVETQCNTQRLGSYDLTALYKSVYRLLVLFIFVSFFYRGRSHAAGTVVAARPLRRLLRATMLWATSRAVAGNCRCRHVRTVGELRLCVGVVKSWLRDTQNRAVVWTLELTVSVKTPVEIHSFNYYKNAWHLFSSLNYYENT